MDPSTSSRHVRHRDSLFIALGWAGAFAIVGAGGQAHVVAGFVVLLGCCFVATVAVLGIVLRADVRHASRAALRRSGIVALASVSSVLLGVAIRAWLGPIELAWCERQVSAIEAYRSMHGEYPADLDDVPDLEPSPWLLRPAYQRLPRELDKYTFCVSAAPLCERWWSSRNHTWLTD